MYRIGIDVGGTGIKVGILDDSLKILAEEPLSDEDKIKPSEKNEQYIKEKVQGIVSHIKELDTKITEAAKNWELERLGKAELAILRLAAYEILFDEDIPNAVAINEAVELAKEYTDERAAAFINGVLAGVSAE